MTAEHEQVSIKRACELLCISRSWYYERRHRASADAADLQDEIENIVIKFPGYGYRRVTFELQRRGHRVNHKRVLRIMREGSWLCRLQRPRRRTTQSEHDRPVFPNLLCAAEITGLNQVWIADITYIRLDTEFVFLAAILDAYSRKVIGWNLSQALDVHLTLTALEMALATRQTPAGLIHHSDRGIQYAAGEYVDRATSAGLVMSMSRRGRPRDNPQAESFFRTLKMEQVYLTEYFDFADAYEQLSEFIDAVYNTKRLHSSLGYRPPSEFEALLTTEQMGARHPIAEAECHTAGRLEASAATSCDTQRPEATRGSQRPTAITAPMPACGRLSQHHPA
jgi:transposase InsO family protein